MQPIDCESRLKELEKTVRILQKKLERSEADRRQLESVSEPRESLLKAVIRELQDSQAALNQRSHELETALENLKTLQLKLIESEKMSALGILVAGIAHEINNPVNFIYGNVTYANTYFQELLELLQLYQRYYPHPVEEIRTKCEAVDLEFITSDLQKLLSSMQMGAERIYGIVRSLRTFSRLDEAEFKAVDIHEGVNSTLVILNNRLKPSQACPQGIEIIFEYGQLPLINCYPGQLNQVFMNILVNAIDALEGIGCDSCLAKENPALIPQACLTQPTIYIRTAVVNNNAVIRIADNGGGIDADLQSKLFDPFFTTKEIGKGTGLGLAISRQIVVEKHGGNLEVKSNPGQGAEFIITIPIKSE